MKTSYFVSFFDYDTRTTHHTAIDVMLTLNEEAREIVRLVERELKKQENVQRIVITSLSRIS